jgi:hypothetical protein
VPVPASDAIASDVGHGALGVRYGLRPMRDLLGETSGQRHVWAELRPKKLLTTWTSVGSGVYSKVVAEPFDGVTLWVVGVRSLTEALTSVESQALCVAGAFYYSGATLYVHFTGGTDPATLDVVAELGVHVGTHGVVHPVLGIDRLANGAFEAWTGAAPDGWTVTSSVSAGTITLDKTTSDPLQGTYAARVTFAAATGAMRIRQDFTSSTILQGQVYRCSGAYRVTSSSGGLRAALYVDDAGTTYLLPDGRTVGASAVVFSDAGGGGEWRRFSFDFICPPWASFRFSFYAETVSGTQSGTIDFDDVHIRPVHRYAYHEPILADGALPTINASRPDAFYGPVSVGLGGLGLLNGGGRLEPLIAGYDWHNAAAVIRVGGRFGNGGNEIPLDDCPAVVSARLASPRVSDGQVTFDLQDDRQITKQTLPRRFLDYDADLAEADQGRPRALAFGAVRNSRPPRVDLAANGCGIYELTDPLYGATRTPGNNEVFCYVSEDAADKQDNTQRASLKAQDFSWDSATNRLTILNDVAPKIVTVENNRVDFNIGGGALVATIAPALRLPGLRSGGAYSGTTYLCDAIATAMNAAAGTADITVTLSASTHKYTIAKGAGTLQLLCSSGANRDVAMWGLLGFDNAADLTGALTYTGGAAVFETADQHIIRMAHVGYVAGYIDPDGTYTGTVGDIVDKAPDVAQFLLRRVIGLATAEVDLSSFVAARSGAYSLAAYIGVPGEGTIELGEILERIGAGSHADITSEAGVWYWRARSAGTVPTPVVDVLESDVLDCTGLYDVEDNYQIARVAYSRDASTGKSKTKENSTNSKASIRFGRPDQRTWPTYLSADADATTRASALATVAGKKPRRYELTVRGKALLLPVGSKLRLTRSRGLGATPPSALLLRILSKTDEWGDWTSRLLAIEDDPA